MKVGEQTIAGAVSKNKPDAFIRAMETLRGRYLHSNRSRSTLNLFIIHAYCCFLSLICICVKIVQLLMKMS